jgi:ABC-type amino acid transport substrate-binding protein
MRDRPRLMAMLAFAVLAAAQFAGPAASAGTIDQIRANGTIRIAYRADAPPFSRKDANSAEPGGFMVDLCREVVKKLATDLNVPSLKVAYVEVTAADRFDAITNGKADLLCEPTSATLSRRKLVDFSIATFVDGASLLTTDSSLHRFKALAGKKVGVLVGTTTEAELRGSVKESGISLDVVPVKTHAEGIAALDGGTISAYFADRSILLFLIKDSKAPDKLGIADDYLSVEPYALALPKGDEDFRLAVDTALSHIYRSAAIGPIFEKTFSGQAKPSTLIKSLYLVSGLPD